MRHRKRTTKRETEGVEKALIRFLLSVDSFNVSQTVQVFVVTMVLKQTAVEFVCAAFGHVVDDRALVATILRGEIVSDYLELLDLILVVDKQGWTGNAQVIVV